MSKPKNHLKVNVYEVLARAIEEGISIGYMRAHKHVEHPSKVLLQESILTEVMTQIAEVFIFEEQE